MFQLSKLIEIFSTCDQINGHSFNFAVGLGNVWRFPYIAYKNGGGTFLIPYLIMLLLVGLPIFFMEFVIGQYMKSGPVKLFGNIAPIFSGIGYMMIALSSIIGVYYNVIMGWSIYYLFAGFTSQLPWADCTNMENYTAITGKYCFKIILVEAIYSF